ncbi:FecR domain-containing protein [Colwellia sp. 1_MG-2023]|jgi:transmembrane sensor|uniref:FecR family protein n=1 Tax=unclassified Colwellia TaxID=196834 RepID=UPI001C0A2EC8|nr:MULTISPECIES: FecR domain-containing protein [unclassified Colwellia]MBU2925651.1 FecR domain-containing protein [Colwellia sp. C2M11]MDO6651123.1 FecR domain-containing protein [Colwellia sp. 3_MG-2023]MDO6666417.1 FecR domain-containing protein [Colwellia sp. 2_MG-2023]MDO6690711.1 FecR domain-containing protein [Colwellia sp. 1_MG-2023]
MSTNVKGFTNKVIINQEAAQWVLLLEDTPELSKAQIEELNAWIRTSSVHRECLESMVNSWGEMDLLSSVMLPQEIHKPSLFLIMLRGLLYPLLVIYVFLSTCIKKRNQLFRVAFVSPLLICLFTWFLLTHNASTMKGEGLIFDTGVGENLSRVMPDGSIIWLNSSTRVQVNYTGEYRRINLLEGEAHFEVAKDKTRPFEVYADNRLVRATGTAFTVHKVMGAIEVLVSEGTVELAIVDNTLVVIPDDYQALKIEGNFEKPKSSNNSTTPLLQTVAQPVKVKKILGNLSAGQRISIPTQSNIVSDIDELDTSEVSRFLSWKKGKLVFAGESLEEVIKEITRHTQVQIDVLDPKLKSMRIGGQFQIGETDTLFYVLESGFGISVNKLNDKHVQLRVKEK